MCSNYSDTKNNQLEKKFIPENHPTLKCINELRDLFKDYPIELVKIDWMELLDTNHLKLNCGIIIKLVPENWPSWKLWNWIYNVEWTHIFTPKAAIKDVKSKRWYVIPSVKDIEMIIDSIPSFENDSKNNSIIIHELLNIKHFQSRWKYWVMKLDFCRIWTRNMKSIDNRVMYRSYEFDFINSDKHEDWWYFHDNTSAFPLRLIVDWDKIPETFFERLINRIRNIFKK